MYESFYLKNRVIDVLTYKKYECEISTKIFINFILIHLLL